MAESIPDDVTSQGERRETGGITTEEKPLKKETVVSHPQRETKKISQKSYGRRRFYNTEYYRCDADNWSPEGREKVKRFHHPHRGYWQDWNEDGQWFNNGESKTSRQYYHRDSYQSVDSLHHRRGGKRSGHKITDSSKVASTQDGTKERKKKTTLQESPKSVTDENGEKTAKKKPDVDKHGAKAEVNKTGEQSTVKVSNQTVDNSVIDESEEKVKVKPYVNRVKVAEMEGRLTAEYDNQSVTVKHKSQHKMFKKKLDTEVTKQKTKEPEKDLTAVEVCNQSSDNSVTYTKRRDKKVKRKADIDKGELTKTDQSTVRTTQRPQDIKDRKHNEPISDNDTVNDKEKNMVIMVGKYQVKKFRPISTRNTEDHTASGTSDSKVAYDKTANQMSAHSHKRRLYHNKAKGAGRHYGGVAVSLQSDVLSQQLTTGQYECMVCCDRVRVKDPVWSCSTCYHVFHLKCIKKWAKTPTNLEEG